ncbi:hypothetical protein [Vibrio sp. VB16]|uniref:hypothetical protein n=1 Tax=Vibrio sp. VB16 TaxID=2785746 RepID=UPI00189D3098|nr:hypothetical protein [Vibrio sp. VB16]UGA56562.1 hypothetical protein IUZ65_020395 [Vibrio sp. VB16]
MKKLTLCAISVSALFAVNANAGDVQLVGFVAPVCEVTGMNSQLVDFGMVDAGFQTINVPLGIQCNDADGATVTLISAEGGLESDDQEDFALTYDAVFTPSGLAALTLNAPGGPGLNDVSASQSYGGSGTLATGVPATLDVTTTETATFSGGYSDTLTIQITQN